MMKKITLKIILGEVKITKIEKIEIGKDFNGCYIKSEGLNKKAVEVIGKKIHKADKGFNPNYKLDIDKIESEVPSLKIELLNTLSKSEGFIWL